jgi:hypothetical protein
MLMRRTPFPLALVAAFLVLPGTGTVAATAAGSNAAVRLVACDPQDRTADVEGDMRAAGVTGAAKLQMRFSVQVRVDGGEDKAEWKRVPAPTLDTWVSAQTGRSRYVYRKHVEGLQPGATYRVLVRFRWRDAAGDVLKSASKHSRSCAVPEDRANLVPRKIDVRPGLMSGRALYLVSVANRGKAAAPATSVAFVAGDQVLLDRPAPALAPGEKTVVAFDGPVCAAGTALVASVDSTGLVDEASEADDVLEAPCTGA